MKHAMALNELKDYFIISHGISSNKMLQDTWQYDIKLNEWRYLAVSGSKIPEPRILSFYFLDSSSEYFFMFGGLSNKGI